MAFAPHRAADLFQLAGQELTSFMPISSEADVERLRTITEIPRELLQDVDSIVFSGPALQGMEAVSDIVSALERIKNALVNNLSQDELEAEIRDELKDPFKNVNQIGPVERDEILTTLVTLQIGENQNAAQDAGAETDASELETMTLERDFALEEAMNTAVLKAMAFASSLNGNVMGDELEQIALAAGVPQEMLDSHPTVLEAFGNQLDRSLEPRGFKVDFDMTVEAAYEQEFEPKPEPEEIQIAPPVAPPPPQDDHIFKPNNGLMMV